MARHTRGSPCRLVNFALGKEDSIAVDWFQSTKPEIWSSKVGCFALPRLPQ
jgi:hypothetical protein